MRELDPLVARAPVERARAGARRDAEDVRPAAVARSTGAGSRARERRGKNLLFPTADGELVLRVHLMSAGRLRYLAARSEDARRRRCSGSASPTAASSSSPRRAEEARRASGSSTPDAARRRSSRTSAPTRSTSTPTRWPRSSARERRQLHPLLRDQRALAGIGRAHANEILLARAALAVQALDRARRRRGRAARERDPRRPRRARSQLRERARATTTSTSSTTASASRARSAATRRSRASTSRSTRSLLPDLPDGRPGAQGPAALAAAALARSSHGIPRSVNEMNDAALASSDVQASAPAVELALSRAGVTGVQKAIRIRRGAPRR